MEGQMGNHGRWQNNNNNNNNVGGNNSNKSPYNNNAGYDYKNLPYNDNTPKKIEQWRSKKKQDEQRTLYGVVLPPFLTHTDTRSNNVEMFNRYHKDDMPPTAPVVQQPVNENSPNKSRCCCIL